MDFNSHTREGVTITAKYSFVATIDFNSHTREGVTRQRDKPFPRIAEFQLTHP